MTCFGLAFRLGVALSPPASGRLDLAAFRERFLSSVAFVSADALVTDDSAEFRPHPGGWAEHGYDDTSDIAEKQR